MNDKNDETPNDDEKSNDKESNDQIYYNDIEVLDKQLMEELTSIVTINGIKNEPLIGHAQFSLRGNVYITFNIDGKNVKATCQVPKIFCQWIKETYNDENSDENESENDSNSDNDESQGDEFQREK